MYEELSQEQIERIMSKVTVKGDADCWNWTKRTNTSGRPIYSVDKIVEGERKSITYSVQRIFFEYYKGETDARTIDVVCGNPLCCNPSHLSANDFQKRFWDNVVVSKSGCWEWQGSVFKNTGYGCITINSKPCLAHRVSYEQSYGEIPNKLMILHKCNNKLCINPEHLYAGTHNDNMKDMANADTLKGERNANSILTEKQVKEIKELISERKMFYKDIADRYGVRRQTIKDIALGRTWSWL
jgi:hypothetical protein